MKKEYENLSEFDFGFSFIDDEINEDKQRLESEIQVNQETAAELQQRLNSLFNAVEPFLDNLCKNPEKSTIYWPDRVDKIKQYKKNLKQIVEGNNK